MKKTVILAGILATVSFFSFGEEILFNNQFEKDSLGKILKWKINPLAEYKPLGKVSAAGDVLTLASTGKAIHFYSETNFRIKKGDTLRITLRAEGKGTVGFGAYFYGTKKGKKGNAFFSHGQYPSFPVSSQPRIFTRDFTIGSARGTNPAVTVTHGKIVLCAGKDSTVKIRDLKAEVFRKNIPSASK